MLKIIKPIDRPERSIGRKRYLTPLEYDNLRQMEKEIKEQLEFERVIEDLREQKDSKEQEAQECQKFKDFKIYPKKELTKEEREVLSKVNTFQKAIIFLQVRPLAKDGKDANRN